MGGDGVSGTGAGGLCPSVPDQTQRSLLAQARECTSCASRQGATEPRARPQRAAAWAGPGPGQAGMTQSTTRSQVGQGVARPTHGHVQPSRSPLNPHRTWQADTIAVHTRPHTTRNGHQTHITQTHIYKHIPYNTSITHPHYANSYDYIYPHNAYSYNSQMTCVHTSVHCTPRSTPIHTHRPTHPTQKCTHVHACKLTCLQQCTDRYMHTNSYMHSCHVHVNHISSLPHNKHTQFNIPLYL